jgi:hypothetical protein
MKKTNFFKLLLVGAFSLSLGFVGCKNYDDEFSDINKRFDKINADLAALKATVDGMDYVTNVALSDNKLTMTITYMKAGVERKVEVLLGEPGSKITQVDGFWAFDGVKTAYPVAGVDLSDYVKIADGATKAELSTAITNALAGVYTKAQVDAAITTALEGLGEGEDVEAAIEDALAALPYAGNAPKVVDGKWAFWSTEVEPADYVTSDYVVAGATVTGDADAGYVLWVYNTQTEVYESVNLPNGVGGGTAITKLDVLGVVVDFDPEALDLGDLDPTVTVKYASFAAFSAGSGQDLGDNYAWAPGGFAAGSVVNTLATEKVGFIVQLNPGATLGANNTFEIVNTAGEVLEGVIGFGTPVAITTAATLTRGSKAGDLFFIPLDNPEELLIVEDEDATPGPGDGILDEYSALLGVGKAYALVVEGLYYSNYNFTFAAETAVVGDSSMTPDSEATDFVLASGTGDSATTAEIVTDDTDSKFETASSGKEYRLALDTEGDAEKILDFYLEWDGVGVDDAEVTILDQIAAPAPTTRAGETPVKGKGFKVTITGAVESVEVPFTVYALGADGVVYSDALTVTVKPAGFPQNLALAAQTVEVKGAAAWADEAKKRLMPVITIPLADMFTAMDAAEGSYAAGTSFSDAWKAAATGPNAVELTSAKIGADPIDDWKAGSGFVLETAETGYELKGDNANVYASENLLLTLPTSYGAAGANATFTLDKKHVLTFTFKKGANAINTVTFELTPVLPAGDLITERPYTFADGYMVDNVLIGWLTEPASITRPDGYVDAVTYSLNRGAFSVPTGNTPPKFAIANPGEYFTAASVDAQAVTEGVTSATPKALKGTDFVTYDSESDVFTLKNQVPVTSAPEVATPTVDDAKVVALIKTAVDAKVASAPAEITGLVLTDVVDPAVAWGGADTYEAAKAVVDGLSDAAKTRAENDLAAALLVWGKADATISAAAIAAEKARLQTEANNTAIANAEANAKLWNAYGKELTMTPTVLSYLKVYNVSKEERAQYEYKVRILSPLDKNAPGSQAGIVVTSDGISGIAGTTITIGAAEVWMKDRQAYKVDLFPVYDGGSKFASKLIKTVEFFKPATVTGGYTLTGAVDGVLELEAPSVGSCEVKLVVDPQLTTARTVTLGVKVYDVFGAVHEGTINVNLTVVAE